MYSLSKKYLIQLYWLKVLLRINRFFKKRVLVFANYLGEYQFYKDVLHTYKKEFPSDIIIIAHESEDCYLDFLRTNSNNKFKHIQLNVLSSNFFSNKEINLYLSTEDRGIDNIYSIYLFHGQPSKALSFHWDKMLKYDAFFLYGEMHKEAFNFFAQKYYNQIPAHIRLYEIGYPKGDELLNGTLKDEGNFKNLGLSQNKKIILYAPAFNKYASLRENGIEILKVLAENNQYNIIAKLPIDCLRPIHDEYANGGVDWFKEINNLQKQYPNLFLYKEDKIDILLQKSDILLTCISSVAFEFLALNKPVIYIDTPKFFEITLKQDYFLGYDIGNWDKINFINGGKEFGPVVTDIKELPLIIEDVFLHPDKYPFNKKKLSNYLLYNPGKASDAAVNQINKLLLSNFKTNRVAGSKKFNGYRYATAGIKKHIKTKLKINQPSVVTNKYAKDYIDATVTENEAKKLKLSICEYLESKNTDTRKIGRRDRIIEQMLKYFPNNKISILEIGTGTGMYLEKLLHLSIANYDVYEVNDGWKQYLKRNYENNIVHIIDADGISLKQTKNESIDIVHAHAVFVYLPIIQIMQYFKEAARVLCKGGLFIFDVINDKDLKVKDALNWHQAGYDFAVITPHAFIEDFCLSYNLKITSTFQEIYAGSTSTYYILTKI
ncbi:MAG: CDP-glycerol glycerophosphotransferase family protein [Bacteroidetes bacterium]|nr:CDP-glycerol glycerophosphotransferase family protein [Bacteroidota bacterium]MBS1649279.1 CDP-glycerol glycerophosphotransferase family protein [Bacteroidota bacterium]